MDFTWAKQTVTCAQCDAVLMRCLFHPKHRRPLLRFFCDRACKGKWQTAQRELQTGADEEWLRQKYEVEGLDCVAIGKLVGRDQKGVWRWLKDYGIATRPRGDATRLPNGREPGFKLSDVHKETLRQARKRDGHFPKNPDGTPYWTGRSGPDHPTWTGGATPERQRFYGSREWKNACKMVWRRTDAKCERCNLDHRTIDRAEFSFHVHHVIPFTDKRYRSDPDNLALLCETCHRFVHSKSNTGRAFL